MAATRACRWPPRGSIGQIPQQGLAVALAAGPIEGDRERIAGALLDDLASGLQQQHAAGRQLRHAAATARRR